MMNGRRVRAVESVESVETADVLCSAETLLAELRSSRLIAIVRGLPADRVRDAGVALADGGVRVLEVTLDSPGALAALPVWRQCLGDVLVGAGTVMDVASARRAVDAGAEFLVCPHVDPAVIAEATRLGVGILPGALTATEVVRATQAGGVAVKVFPIAPVGGPAYVSALLAPLQGVPLVAVGGVTVDDAVDYLEAGATAVGLGSQLVDPLLVREGRWQALTGRAAGLTARLASRLQSESREVDRLDR